MSGDGKFCWWWSRDEESYYRGGATREEAIEQAEAELDPGDEFVICEADKAVLRFNILRAGEAIERFEEQNEEAWGEDGLYLAGGPAVAAADKAFESAVEAALKDLVEAHGGAVAYSFGTMRNVEKLTVRPVPEDAS